MQTVIGLSPEIAAAGAMATAGLVEVLKNHLGWIASGKEKIWSFWLPTIAIGLLGALNPGTVGIEAVDAFDPIRGALIGAYNGSISGIGAKLVHDGADKALLEPADKTASSILSKVLGLFRKGEK
jgi:hypothetical protein